MGLSYSPWASSWNGLALKTKPAYHFLMDTNGILRNLNNTHLIFKDLLYGDPKM